MLNKFKKAISGFLVFGLVITSGINFTACRDDKKDNDDDKKPKTEVSTPQDATDNESSSGKDDNPDSKAADELNSLCNEIFEEIATEDAFTLNYLMSDASSLGLDKYPEVMVNFKIEDLMADLEETDEYLGKLEKIDYDSLTWSQKITYDTLKYYLDCSYSYEGLEYYYEPLGPTIGFQAELPITLSEYKFYTADDIERYLTALPSLYETFDEIIRFEQQKSEKGLFMSDELADRIIEQCNEFINAKEDNYLITSFDKKVNDYEGLSDEEKKDFSARNKEIVLTKIIPAYENLIKGLTDLKGTGKNDGGLCNFEDGKKYYQYLIYTSVGDHVKVREVKKAITKRINDNINDLSKLYIRNNSIFEDIEAAQTRSTDPQKILDELYVDMQQDFPQIPSINYSLKTVDKSLEEFLSPAMYYKPPVDDTSINSIYINEAQVRNTTEFFATLAHEGFPGHMYQYNYEKNNDNYALRQVLEATGVSEGWAKYTEYKSYGYIDDISEDIASGLALNSEISLCVEAIADIGINYEGWTRQDLKDYLSNYFEVDDDVINDVYLSCIESPTNVLCYAYGAIVYENLENQAKKLQKDEFDELEFNRFLLDVGFAPFTTIKERFDEKYDN